LPWTWPDQTVMTFPMVQTHDHNHHVSGLILAAGASRRMGRPKQLLRIKGKSMVALAAEAFMSAGISEIVVVTGHFRKRVERELENYPVRCVLNPCPHSQMIDSVRVGLEGLSVTASGCLILPVDCALVSAKIVKALVKLHWQFPERIIRPHSGKRGGHPVLIPRSFFTQASQVKTLRELFRNGNHRPLDVQLKDRWAFFDMDTPEHYQMALKLLENSRKPNVR